MSRPSILYIGTRNHPLERVAELQAASDSNLDIIIADIRPEPYNEYNIKHFIEIPFAENDIAEHAILNYLKFHHLTPEGVVTWGDGFVELVAKIGEKISLPSSCFEAACNVRNKILTRKIISRYREELNPKYAVFTDEKSFKNGLEKVGVPCLLKPAGSSGGRGIFSIDSLDDGIYIYREFIKYCDQKKDKVFAFFPGEYLIEEKLEGSEHSLAGIISDEKISILGIVDKKIDRTIPLQYQNTTPSKLFQLIQQDIIKIIYDIIPLLGINWCGFHVDFMVVDNKIKILEVGGRLGGECINSHLIPLSINGLNPYKLLLKTIQGIDISLSFEDKNIPDCKAGMRHLIPSKPGTLREFIIKDKLKNHPYVREFIKVKYPGDKLYLPKEKHNSYTTGYIISQCPINEDIDTVLEELVSLIDIRVS